MRVCIVREYFVPLDPRVHREIQALRDAGHHVDVVCLRGEGEPIRERDERLRIYRLPLPRKRGGHPALQLVEYLVFFAIASVLVTAMHLRRRYDVVQANSVPDFLVYVAAGPRLLGARAVLDLHECMPEFFASKFKTGLDHRGAKVLAAVEQASIRFADAAFTCTDPMREQFVARGADPDEITVLLNGSDETVFEPARFPRRRGDDGEFRIISHGSVEERYGLDTVIRAMAILRDEMPELRFHVYGSGTFLPALRELASELGIADRVWFSGGFVPIEELVQAVADADVGVVGMKQDAFRDLTLANKMYDFIAMRTPQLVSRTRSVEAYFDETAFALFRSDDAEDLARAIREIRHDPDRRARMVEAAVRQAEPHRWPVNGARYVSVLESTAGAAPVSGSQRGG